MKSFLAARNTTKSTIKNKLRHDLPKVMAECHRLQIPSVELLSEYVAHTHEMNKDYDFRYPSGYNLSMPRPSECAPIARALAIAIKPIVESSALKAQLRFSSEIRHLKGKNSLV